MIRIKNQTGNIALFVILIILILASVTLGFGSPSISSGKYIPGEMVTVNPEITSKAIQLRSLAYITRGPTDEPLTPLPAPLTPQTYQNPAIVTDSRIACVPDTYLPQPDTCRCAEDELKCQNGKLSIVFSNWITINNTYQPGTPGYTQFIQSNTQRLLNYEIPLCSNHGDGRYCLEKPIIYLYPEKLTFVNVGVKTPGTIVKSDPHYPDNGWKNILASPNGTLVYNEKTYSELFYESSSHDYKKPTTGIIIAQNQLESKLKEITGKLGLKNTEQKEFVDYWTKRVSAQHKPYVLMSLIDPAEKERIDHLIITPQPHTIIAFLAYFKPLDTPIPIAPLEIPAPQTRNGFVVVEWGGILDQ